MSDTRIERSICEAIEIIADKKIAQASFDKTIKAVVNSVLDRTTGKYEIKYQDSLFQAYATSSEINYSIGQEVFILIPSNDWDRTKTILNGVDSSATTYKEIPMVGDLYNTIGGNLAEVKNSLDLSSYYDQTIVVYDIQKENNKIYINQQAAKRYITQGNGLALGMVARTELATGQQIAGVYGVRVFLRFKDSKGDAAVRDYVVNSTDVIGQPYSLIKPVLVERFIESIDTENFECIQKVQIYCNNFPQDQSKKDIKDIFISDIKINGATALTEQELSGYSLHIACNNETLSGDKTIVTLEAQLKLGGKIIKDKVEYYWFRQNGLIFRGSNKYSGFAGDGWECLNYYSNNTPVATEDTFNFTSDLSNVNATTVLAVEKDTKVKCVAVYNKRERVSGQTHVYNQNITNNISIISSDIVEGKNKDVYFLGSGLPTLKCNALDKYGEELENITYTWSVTPARGRAEIKEETEKDNAKYLEYEQAWAEQIKYAQSLAPVNKEEYINLLDGDYQKAKTNWESIKDKERVDGKYYVNFPISSITDYSKTSCAVTQGETYLGTASITIYNKMQPEGTYSLFINNGTQVFQYDGKGNSPASKQLEKPLVIQSLTFTLLDNTGTQISYEQIINNGYVKWLIPYQNTMVLSDGNGDPDVRHGDTTAIGADLAFAADYDIYNNRQSFGYTIADNYDAKKTLNYIRLNIKYLDLSFDAYTNFTFPKDGDPGTNGTDYVVKLTPDTSTQRVYVCNKFANDPYDDNGKRVDKLNFQLYNNSRKIEGDEVRASLWTCPPKGTADDKIRGNTYLTEYEEGKIRGINKNVDSVETDLPINIIRASFNNGDLRQYAEYPICYVFLNGSENSDYRFKIKPQSGFKYAVYQEDGTSPQYDNTLPFEVIVEKRDAATGYYIIQNTGLDYDWSKIGSIQEDENRSIGLNKNKKYYKPSNTFDGSDLTSAVLVRIYNEDRSNYIGYIHVPIYMIINRYGHAALNNWDGNSIQLNANGDTILAPQIGAGKKETDNSFTGVFMGDVKDNTGKEKIGIMAYQHGERSIFLNAQTGSAEFGKQGSSQIKIDAQSGQGTIQSGDYSYPNGKGMKIKFSQDGDGPYIRYGSGRFTVDENGNITAKGGGTIANWKISNDALTSQNDKVYLRSGNYNTSYPYAIYSNGTFSVTSEGYLTSTSGKIAKWSIDDNAITDSNVGMGQGKTIAANTFENQGSEITNARIWSGDGNITTFAVTANGKLYSRDGQIASWSISKDQLTHTSGKMGMGSYGGVYKINSGSSTYNTDNNAIFWSNNNFAVDEGGKLYSSSGKIGGWNINSTQLKGGNTIINSNGSLSNSGGNNGTWAINNDGSSSFTNIDASGGKIGNYTISGGKLSNGNVTLTADGNLQATGGKIGKVSIDGTGLHGTGFDITDSYARFTGLRVDSSGNVNSSSGGGIASSGGSGSGWTMPGGSAKPSWNYGGKNMEPTLGRLYKNLVLTKKVRSTGTEFKIPTNTEPLGNCISLKTNSQTITGTVGADGKFSISIPTYSLSIDKNYGLIQSSNTIGSNIIVGWNSKTSYEDYMIMASPITEQSTGSEQ